jgi:hypothetical protein
MPGSEHTVPISVHNYPTAYNSASQYNGKRISIPSALHTHEATKVDMWQSILFITKAAQTTPHHQVSKKHLAHHRMAPVRTPANFGARPGQDICIESDSPFTEDQTLVSDAASTAPQRYTKQ